MAQLLIPSCFDELQQRVEQVLELAKKHGFSVDHIELGVSPAQTIVLQQGESSTSIAISRSTTSIGDVAADIDVIIGSLVSIDDIEFSEGQLFLNARDGNHSVDVWHDGEIKAIRSSRVDDYDELTQIGTIVA